MFTVTVKYFVTVSVFHDIIKNSQEKGPGRQKWLYYINIELLSGTDNLKGNRLVYASLPLPLVLPHSLLFFVLL